MLIPGKMNESLKRSKWLWKIKLCPKLIFKVVSVALLLLLFSSSPILNPKMTNSRTKSAIRPPISARCTENPSHHVMTTIVLSILFELDSKKHIRQGLKFLSPSLPILHLAVSFLVDLLYLPRTLQPLDQQHCVLLSNSVKSVEIGMKKKK